MFTILALQQHISAAPGLANRNRPGCLGLAGGYTAAALQLWPPAVYWRPALIVPFRLPNP